MSHHTDTADAVTIVNTGRDKKRARLNCMRQLPVAS